MQPIDRSTDDHYEPHIEQVAYTSATWFGIDQGARQEGGITHCLRSVHSSVCLQSQRIPWNCLAFKRSRIVVRLGSQRGLETIRKLAKKRILLQRRVWHAKTSCVEEEREIDRDGEREWKRRPSDTCATALARFAVQNAIVAKDLFARPR